MQTHFHGILIRFSDFLTGSRPVAYVRRMQVYLLVLTLLVTTVALAYPSLTQPSIDLSPNGKWGVGKNAPANIVAVTNLEFPRLHQYEIAKKEAARQAPIFFIRDFSILGGGPVEKQDDATTRTYRDLLQRDMERMATCRRESTTLTGLRECIRSSIPLWRRLPDQELNTVLLYPHQKVKDLLEQMGNILFQRFVILKDPLDLPDFTGSTVKVKDINTGSEPVVNTLTLDSVIPRRSLFQSATQEMFLSEAEDRMRNIPSHFREALVYISTGYFYNIQGVRFSPDETVRSREKAMSRVDVPIFKISRGDFIVKMDEVITDEKYEALKRYNQARFLDTVRRVIAIFTQQVVLVLMILYFAFRFGFRRLSDVASNLIIFSSIWIFLIVLFLEISLWSRAPEYNEVSHFFGSWVPIGFFSLLLSIVFGEVLTIPVGIYMAFLVFIASKYDPNSFIISVTIAVTGAVLGPRIKKRVHFITSALVIAFVAFVMVTASYLYSNRPILGSLLGGGFLSQNYLDAVQVTLVAGLSSMFVIAVLPLFESVFNVPTRFKLIELADPSNPLLQELFRRAPSTWTHTLMVAAMSEKACERLGLNTMLTRTGVYYHDIGKMKNAAFFVENKHLMPKPENIDRNNPQIAAKVIIDHVLDGIQMARAARLPREVIAFIPEHHGTSTMSFFYHKALEKGKRKVQREHFRYPGPRPQSKETAIVMIADSVEAASRSLEEVNERSVDEMIQKIITMKLAESQLDESGLTLGDLAVIRLSFRDILLSSYHFRPRYPESDAVRKLELDREARLAAKKASAASQKPGVPAKKALISQTTKGVPHDAQRRAGERRSGGRNS